VHPKGVLVLPTGGALPDLTPSLTWLLNADQAGDAAAEVTYLTEGLTWSADYALTVLDKEHLVSFDAWVTVDNTCGLDLDKVGLMFTDESAAPSKPDATKPVIEPGAGKRFYLPPKASLAAGETRRFVLAQAPTVRGGTRYVATLGPDGLLSLRSAIQIANNAAAGLGLPLPAGPVRVYSPDKLGRLQLAGRQMLAQADPDQPLVFELGAADGLQATVDTSAAEGGVVRRTVHLKNLKSEDVTVRVVEKRGAGLWQVADSSQPFGAVRDGQAAAEITVPANGNAELHFQVHLPVSGVTNAAQTAPTTTKPARTGGA